MPASVQDPECLSTARAGRVPQPGPAASERNEMTAAIRKWSVTGRHGGHRRRGRALTIVAACVAVLTLVGFAAAGVRGGAASSAGVKGRTLVLLGQSDIFNLDTTTGYYNVVNILE